MQCTYQYCDFVAYLIHTLHIENINSESTQSQGTYQQCDFYRKDNTYILDMKKHMDLVHCRASYQDFIFEGVGEYFLADGKI